LGGRARRPHLRLPAPLDNAGMPGKMESMKLTAPVTRRKIIKSAGMLASGLALNDPLMQALAQTGATPAKKLKAIVAGGHPGDPEYGCGGAVARLTALGHDVTLLYLNNGAWPPTSEEIRIAEAKKACEILKAKPVWAGQQNGHAVVDNDHYQAFSALLTAEKPDLVLTQWPIDNHRDHRAISMLSYDAWRQSKHAFALYYYEVSDGEDTLQFSPTHYIDISQTAAIKRAACYAHASQTPDRYYALQEQVAAFRGIEAGFAKAEAFLLQRQSPADPLQILITKAP
jgi:N-acetylglucosamine malate deacetylase 1